MLVMQLLRQEAMAALRQPLDRIKLKGQAGRALPEPERQPEGQQQSVAPYWRYWRGHAFGRLRHHVDARVAGPCLHGLKVQGFCKKLFPKYNPKTEFPKFWAANLVSGAMAATFSMLLVYPGGVVQALLDFDSLGPGEPRFSGAADVVRRTWAQDRLTGFYSGIGAAILGIVGYRGLQLALYDSITGLNPYKQDQGTVGTVAKFLFAQAAIHFGAAASYPLDTVRVRLMLQADRPASERPYEGPIDCLRKIAAEEGVLALYAGFGYMASLSIALAAARMWLPAWGF